VADERSPSLDLRPRRRRAAGPCEHTCRFDREQ